MKTELDVSGVVQKDSSPFKKIDTESQMLRNRDDILKEECKRLIEQKLGWGSSAEWTNRDFDMLSDQIFDVTGVNLSQTTLKRIWGKVKYDSAPTVTTLNALAHFLGFEHWREFRQKQESPDTGSDGAEVLPGSDPSAAVKENNPAYWIVALALGCSVLGVLSWKYFSTGNPAKKSRNADAYSFSSRKIVSKGLPNSVVFEYDAAAASTDSVFIQQSWDARLRSRVSKNQHLHSSIYYYPGFFQARLLAGDQILKEQDVFIETDGWLCLAEQEPVPVYFKKEQSIRNGKMALPLSTLAYHHLETGSVAPWVFYANIREFGDLFSNNFILEASVRNDFATGSGICQKSEIRVLCEGSMISVPLSAKGCISDNNLFCLDRYYSGKEYDLSGFGVDFSKFVKLRVEVKNGSARFLVADKMVYQIDSVKISSKIKGVVFRFQGTGSVDWVKLYKGNGNLIYDEEF